MPRKKREKSILGIYHVMLRGINKQNIFFSDKDYRHMMSILQNAHIERGLNNVVLSDQLCTIYAYCILDNHLHLLIKEGDIPLHKIIQKIATRYAVYYNIKYTRVGHLFQGPFASEPVNDMGYFHVLLRYIHRNSVKAMEAATPEEYAYSSWNEYVQHKSNIMSVIQPSAMQFVLDEYPLSELTEWVNMDKEDSCMDLDDLSAVITDQGAMEILKELSQINNQEDFRSLDPPTQILFLLQAIDNGVSLRQASRLGSLTYSQIKDAYNKKSKNLHLKGQTLKVEKAPLMQIQDEIRRIDGLNKRTYFKLHQIAEYLVTKDKVTCTEIADYLGCGKEQARRYLVRLSNVNIIGIEGKAKNTTYHLLM